MYILKGENKMKIKMKNTYNTMKGLARKYAVPAMIGLSAIGAIRGCSTDLDTELPVNQETTQSIVESYNAQVDNDNANRENRFRVYKTNLNGLVEKYEGLETELERDFNKSIADRVYDATEQESIYNKGFEMEKVLGKFVDLKEKAREEGFEYKSEIERTSTTNVYTLTDENRYGLDFGTPEIEKVMKNKGLEVAVERNSSGIDQMALSTFIFSLYVLGFLGTVVVVNHFTRD